MGSWYQPDSQRRGFDSVCCICLSASTIAYSRSVIEVYSPYCLGSILMHICWVYVHQHGPIESREDLYSTGSSFSQPQENDGDIYLLSLVYFSGLFLLLILVVLVPHWLWWKTFCDVGLYKAKTAVIFFN